MGGIKNYILRMKKKIDEMRRNDPKAKQLLDELDEQSSQLSELFAELNCLEELFPDDEKERATMAMTLNENLEDLNQLHKMTKEEYLNHIESMATELRTFKARYAGLFDKFCMGDIDLDALNHCLDTFELYATDQIDEETAKEMGYYKFHKEN